MTQNPWQQAYIIQWTQSLLTSYTALLGQPLIPPKDDVLEAAKDLFFAPFVVVSHGLQYPQPIFNYGNDTALNLWEMTWTEFTQTPSSGPVEPSERESRQLMLEKVQQQGYIDNYRGVRIAKSGKRFWIENVIVWTVLDDQQTPIGQAATFPRWTFI